jgi:hypothetical protein
VKGDDKTGQSVLAWFIRLRQHPISISREFTSILCEALADIVSPGTQNGLHDKILRNAVEQPTQMICLY